MLRPSLSVADALRDTVPPEAIKVGEALVVTVTTWTALFSSLIVTTALPETQG
jgi:hypothetical protein